MNEQTNGKPPTENRATALVVVVSEEIIYMIVLSTQPVAKNKKFYIIP